MYTGAKRKAISDSLRNRKCTQGLSENDISEFDPKVSDLARRGFSPQGLSQIRFRIPAPVRPFKFLNSMTRNSEIKLFVSCAGMHTTLYRGPGAKREPLKIRRTFVTGTFSNYSYGNH